MVFKKLRIRISEEKIICIRFVIIAIFSFNFLDIFLIFKNPKFH